MWCRIGLVLVLVAAAVPAHAAERVEAGAVARAQGDVRAAHDGTGRAVATGAPVYLGDTLLTGKDARVQVRLTDGTDLTLGADGALKLDDLLVAPLNESDGLSILAGAFRIVAPPTPGATVRTAYATIGIRGTEFWGGPLDGVMDVVALEGTVEVATAGGAVVLTAGEGTVVPTAGAAPGAAGRWGPEKLARAIATVTFQ